MKQQSESEIQIQAKCYQQLWNQFPSTRRCLFSVPNGGTRDVREMGQLKASGLLPGASDMILLWDGKGYCLEFKDASGRQDPEQVKFQEAVERAGIQYYIIRNVAEFEFIVYRILSTNPQLLTSEENAKLRSEESNH